ncbi:MAG: OmpA family protein [Pseudomonadota bacterium]
MAIKSYVVMMVLLTATAAAQPLEAVKEPIEPIETTVFFDYGRNDLGPAGLLLVREIGSRALAAGYTKVRVEGHADAAGPKSQNLATGEERAEAVASELIKTGFRARHVEVSSAGESKPLRSHEDERSEPLNRRAELVFIP